MTEITETPTRRGDIGGALVRLKWPAKLAGRREVTVAATVVVVLALATWAMISFHADRLSPLPRRGNPLPAMSTLEADLALETEVALVTGALTRRDTSGELMAEAIYGTTELFSALSRRKTAHQRSDKTGAESVFQAYLRYHETDRYMVFILTLESNNPRLIGYSPQTASRLRTASGLEMPAESWMELSSPTPDYRRVGLLHFPRATAGGQSLLTEDDGWLELEPAAPEGEELALRWELPIAYPAIPETREEIEE